MRKALKEREVLIKRSGTSSETAEASYHIRVMTRQLKEDVTKMNEIMIREEKKRGKKRLADEELGVRREIISLCNQHIQECEELEKRRFADKEGIDRAELLQEPAQAAGISVDGKRRPYGAQEKPESNEVRRALFEGACIFLLI